MNIKHTPGPWKLVGSSIRAKDPDFCSPEGNEKFETHGFCICTTQKSISNSAARNDKVQANINLILAAPEMLALLEQVSKLISRDERGGQTYDSYVYASGIQTEIDIIIDKAKGVK